MKIIIKKFIIILLLLTELSFAQQFILDTSYALSGINNTSVDCSTSILLNDNKLIIPYKEGATYPYLSPTIGVKKYDPSGNLDTTFGINGIGLYTSNDYADRYEIYGVTLQPDGKIVVVGQASTVFSYYFNFFLIRFNANGTIDNTFGINGLVKYSINTYFQYRERFVDVAIDNNNKIVAIGYTEADIDSKSDAVAVRFLTNGDLDTSFASNGILKLNIPDSDYFNQIKILNDNSILFTGGKTLSTSNQDIIIAKVDELGIFDSTFGANGITTIDFDLGIDSVSNIFFKPNNKIMLIGSSTVNTLSTRAAFAQIDFNGNLDTTFSIDGKNTIYINVINHYSIGAAFVEILPDNKYLICSTTKRNDNTTNNYDYAVARINENTTLDTNFANNGVYVNVLTQTHEYAKGVHIQNDGKALILVNSSVYSYLNTSPLNTINDNENSEEIIILPNPFEDYIHIKTKSKIDEIKIFNIEGKKIDLDNFLDNKIDLSNLEKGIYFLKIYSGNKFYNQKLIKN